MRGQTNTERGRAVRARLLAAARELIGELGWSAVSTRVLAERAGVRPGLVHYHFESLQALLCHAALEEIRQMLDGATSTLTQATSPADSIETMLFNLDQYSGSDPASLLFIETYLAATRDRELRQKMSALVAGFRGSLTDALTRAGHPSPEGAASAVMAVFDGFVLHKGFDPDLSAPRMAPLLRRITTTEENGEHR
jgi:AcrR family transcriptional regulator